MPLHGLTPVVLEPEPSGLGRLFGRRATENAYRKLHNLVATTPIRDVSPETIEEILREYRIELQEARPRLRELYTMVLAAFARDDVVTDGELEDLRRLRDLFGLGAGDVAMAGVPVYRDALDRAAADQRVTEEERQRLAALVERLRLPDRIVQETQREVLGAIYERVLAQVGADRRLSPEEEGQLQALASDLGLSVTAAGATSVLLDRFRLLWRIENGELPDVDAPIRLAKGERCHAALPSSHHEFRTVTDAVGYTGPTARIRLAKGVYWRFGAIKVAPIRRDVLKELDTGTLYVTNRRLLFDGTKRNRAFPYAKIINVKLYQDGLQIERDTGKDQYFQFTGDAELLGAILNGAMREQEDQPTRRGPARPRTARASSSQGRPSAAAMPEDARFRHFFASIAGESHVNRDGSSRQAILARCHVAEPLRLEREPDNPVDPHALKVCRLTGEQLGYVPADLAEDLVDDLDHLVPFLARVGRPAGGPHLGGVLLIVALRVPGTDDQAVAAYARAVLAADTGNPA
jgi:hypothetical protein